MYFIHKNEKLAVNWILNTQFNTVNQTPCSTFAFKAVDEGQRALDLEDDAGPSGPSTWCNAGVQKKFCTQILFTLCDVQMSFILEKGFSVCMPPKNPSRRESRLDEWPCDCFLHYSNMNAKRWINPCSFFNMNTFVVPHLNPVLLQRGLPMNTTLSALEVIQLWLFCPLQTTQSHFLSKRHKEKKKTG